jgi:hypothetical protein
LATPILTLRANALRIRYGTDIPKRADYSARVSKYTPRPLLSFMGIIILKLLFPKIPPLCTTF